jgi:hypothetical protein
MGFSTLNQLFQLDIVSDNVAPPFLQGPNGSAWLGAMGKELDLIRYRSAQAQLVHMPGAGGDPSGLFYIGLDRLMPQGPAESDLSYTTRLQGSFDVWQRAGSDWAVLQETLAYLLPKTPAGLIVSDTSVWSYYGASATPASKPPFHLRFQGQLTHRFNWNWDGETFDPHPSGGTAWWRTWLVLFADLTPIGNLPGHVGGINAVTNANPTAITTDANHGLANGNVVWIDEVHGNLGANGGPFVVTVTSPTSFTIPVDTTAGGAYTTGGIVYLAGANSWVGPSQVVGNFTVGAAYTVGLSVPSAWIDGLRAILLNWKAANAWFRYMIVSLDSGFFQPDAYAGSAGLGSNPDGTYGPWAAPVGGVYVCTRNRHARYADGVA